MAHRALLLVDLQNDFAPARAGGSRRRQYRRGSQCAYRLEPGARRAHRRQPGLASGGSRQFRQPAPGGTLHRGRAGRPGANFWPDHCVQHSEGAALHPLLKQQAIAAVFHKGQNRLIDSYSAFFDNGHRQKTELDGWLRGQGIVELTVLGLATDYCVKFTVLDALALGYAVNVITDGCRGVNLQPQDSSQAFMEMAAAGATLYTLDDWRETQA